MADPVGRRFALRVVRGAGRPHNAAFVLFVGAVLAYGAGFAWYMLERFDLVDLLHHVNMDDSFYYFQIAHHMADGKLSTFDGGITRTNGYHPLWLLLIAPFYWMFDKVEALFAIKAFEIGLLAGAVALVAGAARVARLPWILLFAALPMLFRERRLFLGMEAAAGVFMLGLFLLAICLFARSPARWKWPLAAVAFTLPWVRLEAVAVALAATAALCLIEWSGGERRSPPASCVVRGAGSLPPSTGVLFPFLAGCAGLLTYFAWNAIVFGGSVPVSGATKLMWWQLAWEEEGGYSFVRNLWNTLHRPAFDQALLAATAICVCLPPVWWLTRRSRDRKDRLPLAFLAGVFGLAAGHLSNFAQVVLTMHPFARHPTWYFASGHLVMTLLVPATCYAAIHVVRRFIGPRPHRAVHVANLGVAATGAAFLLATTDFTAPFRHVDREGVENHWNTQIYMHTMMMDRVLPEDSVVGSWDSGIMGYFSRFPVVNLDGLVNSWDYLRAWKEGAEAAEMRRYGITHFSNGRQSPSGRTGPFDGQEKGWSAPTMQSPPSSRAILLEGPEFSSFSGRWIQMILWRAEWFRERMEPRLVRRTGDAGMLVEGRMARAFAADCAPDEVAVWTWAGDGDGTAARSWTKTRSGLCVSTIVLPRGVLPPVRVVSMTVGEYLAGRVGDGRPAVRSVFDVRLIGNTLVYTKEPCGPEDVYRKKFFVYLDPILPYPLPGHRWLYGPDALRFHLDWTGAMAGGKCLAELPLPEYGIAAITTGQYTNGRNVMWEEVIRLGE